MGGEVDGEPGLPALLGHRRMTRRLRLGVLVAVALVTLVAGAVVLLKRSEERPSASTPTTPTTPSTPSTTAPEETPETNPNETGLVELLLDRTVDSRPRNCWARSMIRCDVDNKTARAV